MAHHLQALTLLAAAAGGFSHQVHIRLKLDCATCHTAAPASVRAGDNLLPKAEACQPCHAEREIRAAPTPRFVMKFSHAAHNKTLNCRSCHRMAEGVANPGFPTMAFCIGCHNKIDVPDSCMKCHLPAQDLQPASHREEGFFDRHTSGAMNTKNAGCAACHGRDFTCQGCH